eukprot:UN33884
MFQSVGECVSAYTISGTSSNHNDALSLILTVDGVETTKSLAQAGDFSFDPIAEGSEWSIRSDPSCHTDPTSGTLAANVDNVTVDCTAEASEESDEIPDPTMAIVACMILLVITFGCCCSVFWYFITTKI